MCTVNMNGMTYKFNIIATADSMQWVLFKKIQITMASHVEFFMSGFLIMCVTIELSQSHQHEDTEVSGCRIQLQACRLQ